MPSEYQVIKAKIIKVFRAAYADHGSETHHSDDAFLSIHSLPTPHCMIVAERLSLYCRVLLKGTLPLQASLAAARTDKNTRSPRTWLRAVQQDIEWVSVRFEALAMLRGLSFPEASIAISEDPRKLRNIFRKCLLTQQSDPYLDIDGASKNRRVQIDPYATFVDLFTCNMCRKKFKTEQAKAAHMSKQHGTRCEAAQWCRSRGCWGCGVSFWTWPRIYQHLNKYRPRNKCLELIRSIDSPLSDRETIDIRTQCLEDAREAKALGVRAHFAKRACRRIIGPSLRCKL